MSKPFINNSHTGIFMNEDVLGGFCFWLYWGFLAAPAFLSLWRAEATSSCCVQASCGGSSSCGVAWALGHRGCVRFQVLEHRLSSCGAWDSCSATCGILPHWGSNLCLLHWQADYPGATREAPVTASFQLIW